MLFKVDYLNAGYFVRRANQPEFPDYNPLLPRSEIIDIDANCLYLSAQRYVNAGFPKNGDLIVIIQLTEYRRSK